MSKKLTIVCVAIAAFAAFVLAPSASASPVLTESGSALATGASLKATNTGVTAFTASGFNVACSNDVLSGTVTKNSGGEAEIEIPLGSAKFNGTGTGGDCTSAIGSAHVTITLKICIRFRLSAPFISSCGVNIKIDIEVTGTGNCEYSAASIPITYNTNADATFNISAGAMSKVAGGIFCPSSSALDMDFDLTTTDGTTLTIS